MSRRLEYPYCIVWTPLPIVTWFCPIIGHTGIANSKGIIYDFSDDYNVSVDNFSFGNPTKFYQFNPKLIPLSSAATIAGTQQQQQQQQQQKSVSVSASTQERQRALAWDKAIKETSEYYALTRHSLFFNNCHQYISGVLNKLNYANKSNWTQTEVWYKITFRSEYSDFIGFIRQWWPFAIIMTGVIILLITIFT